MTDTGKASQGWELSRVVKNEQQLGDNFHHFRVCQRQGLVTPSESPAAGKLGKSCARKALSVMLSSTDLTPRTMRAAVHDTTFPPEAPRKVNERE